MGHPRWPMSSYPKSWFVAAYSDDLGHKQVQPLKFFGQNLVMYRTEKGEAVLLDAYCAHMGTHLGMGGVVAGDAIRCPLHGWQFNESGDCMQVPYAEGVPRNASIRSWPIREISGLIWIYYDPAGEASPAWEPPTIPEYHDGDWTPFSAEGCRWVISSHPQIVHENTCDIQHMWELHGLAEPAADPTRTDGPVLHTGFRHKRGYVTELIDVETSISVYGMGLTKQDSVGSGSHRSSSLLTATPIDENTIDLRISSAVERLDSPESTERAHQAVIATMRTIVEEDIPLWESRNYRIARFYKNENGLPKFRRWSRQFYDAADGLP